VRFVPVAFGALAILVCGCSSKPCSTVSQTSNTPAAETANAAAITPLVVTPLILEKDEGERRVVRPWPGHPDPGESFILKVDPKNGGSKQLVLFTADIRPGGAIDAHRHPHADEILYFTSGTARVHVGDLVRDVHAGATVFIPAGTWISATNIGPDPISSIAIFSAPGFEDFMRAASVREGEKNVPLSKAENDELMKAYMDAVVYKEP
jgi:quercetin dioxygenase-like cupin family protein